jgi:hypothetical protein
MARQRARVSDVPPRARNREEVVNTLLAVAISRLGVIADAETIHFHGRHRPDVLFELRGLRIVIEGKFGDSNCAEDAVMNDARKRVKSGIAHIVAAVIYPQNLRTTATSRIPSVLEESILRFRIVAETRESESWFEGSPAALMDTLRRAQESLTQDDIVEQTAKSLSAKLAGVAKLWMGQHGACDRLSDILGIKSSAEEDLEHAAGRRETAAKISALVLANAFIFQEQLAATDRRITPLRRLDKELDLTGAVCRQWTWVWTNINYVPIFQIGERILAELPSSQNTTSAVRAVLHEAQLICDRQAALRHDLMGRIYHWLLHDAKFLGTYYTSVPAATLLLKLTFSLPWKQNFGEPSELANFKTGDLACGTGTLLMACAQAVTDQYIKKRAADDKSLDEIDLQTLHKTLMENILHGYDVLPSAVHLTASTLAMLAPEVTFRNMNLFVMPLGLDGRLARLGSLDFLDSPMLATQMSLDYSHAEIMQTSVTGSHAARAAVPKLDLCVMNPPFVRSVYGNLLFGSLSEGRDELQKELSKRTKKLGISATAGLGAVFVSLADKHVRPGGRIAFVLPITLATGEAWSGTRKLIAANYHLEIVVTSHDVERLNFSENTELSELLFIARRLEKNEVAGATAYVNLRRNPRSIHEALDVAARIAKAIKEVGGKEGESKLIRSANSLLGEVTALPSPISSTNWTGALFAQSFLMRVHWALNAKSELHLPGDTKAFKLKLCFLDELGTLGCDARDIFDAFSVDRDASEWSPHLGFWDHDAQKVTRISQKPNATLFARTEPIPGRNLKPANAVWEKSGKILLVSRLRTNTHRVIATGFSKRVLGNTWWGFDDSDLSSEQRKSLLLWLNGTLSILSYFGRRAITQGAWMQMKKPAWSSMPVLNVRQLSKENLRVLSDAYDRLAGKDLRPIAQLDVDPVRRQIDDILCSVLQLPDLSAIRTLLAREPGLTAKEMSDPVEVVNAKRQRVAGHIVHS